MRFKGVCFLERMPKCSIIFEKKLFLADDTSYKCQLCITEPKAYSIKTSTGVLREHLISKHSDDPKVLFI